MDDICCAVCLNTYENPHVLTKCGHTFCMDCIESAAQGKEVLRCPICRKLNRVNQAVQNFALCEMIEQIMVKEKAKRFKIEAEAATKIQAVFRGAMTREDTNFSEAVRINPNDFPDNTPPDSGEGLNLDYYGVVEGHPNWGSWRPNLNQWVYQCPSQILTWWWDSSKRVWVRDTTSAFFERFKGKW